MKKRIPALLCILVMLVGMLATPAKAFAYDGVDKSVSDVLGEMTDEGWQQLRLTNEVRLSKGLLPLSVFGALQQAAAIRAKELTVEYHSDHTRLDGSACFSVIDQVGLTDWRILGENIAQGQENAKLVTDAWCNSSEHLENIMTAEFTHMGIGYDAVSNSWVQLFYGTCRSTILGIEYGKTGGVYAKGTAINDMSETLVLICRHGESYLPISAGMCSGYDPALVGVTQTVTVTYGTQTTTFQVTLTPDLSGQGEADGLFYVRDNRGDVTITGSNRQGNGLVIPSDIDGFPVTAIAKGAFRMGHYDSVTLPETLKSIGDYAFFGAKIGKTITIPASVKKIGIYAFSYCYGLTAIQVEKDNERYCSVDGILFNQDMTVLCSYPMGKLGKTYTVPESVTLLYCTSMAYSHLQNLIVPNAQTGAMTYTFWGSHLTIYCVPEGKLWTQEKRLTGELTLCDVGKLPQELAEAGKQGN